MRLKAAGDPQLLFPATRRPQRPIPGQSLDTMIQSAVSTFKPISDRFAILTGDNQLGYVAEHVELSLHDTVPDLIAQELAASHSSSSKNQYSPYQGHTMVIVDMSRLRLIRRFICFPMGELGNQLSKPFFRVRARSQLTEHRHLPFLAFYKSKSTSKRHCLYTRSTGSGSVPNGDIAALLVFSYFSFSRWAFLALDGQSSNIWLEDTTALLCRLHSSTRLLNVTQRPPIPISGTSFPVQIQEVATLHAQDTDARRHVDVALDPAMWSRALVVDECGGVWLWSEDLIEAQERLEKLYRM